MTSLVLDLSLIEAAHLTDLVQQFLSLLQDTVDEDAADDPAVARLVPDAYRDDTDAADEFRRLTQADLLDRRRDDAALVATTLRRDGEELTPDSIDEQDAASTFEIRLGPAEAAAWLRTLTAIRLVLATRLGITDDADDVAHPRFGVYNWLGYRLDGLVEALDSAP